MADRVIVVGAGVCGLSAAYRLTQRGFDVTVLEAEEQVGGKTAATRRDGFVLNRGATVLAGSYDAMFAIVDELGLRSQLVEIDGPVGIVKDGEVHWLRGSGLGALVDFVRTPLLSARSKLLLARAGIDAFRARKQAGYDRPDLRAQLDTESVEDYCRRRLNMEICDNLFSPLMGALYVIDGHRVSVAELFFALSKFLTGGMFGYRDGVDFYARALAERMDVRTGSRVALIEAFDDGAQVTWSQNGDQHSERVAGVISTVAGPQVPGIYPGLDPEIQGILLEGIQAANYVGVRLALSRRPEGDGLLVGVPKDELGGLGSVIFEHNVSPSAAPPGKGVLAGLLYHEWGTPRLELSDDELLEQVLPDFEAIVPGIADMIEWAEITRWVPGAPRSEPGMHRLMAQLDALIDTDTRVQLAGDYLTIASVNGSVVTGEVAARRLADTIERGAATSTVRT